MGGGKVSEPEGERGGTTIWEWEGDLSLKGWAGGGGGTGRVPPAEQPPAAGM